MAREAGADEAAAGSPAPQSRRWLILLIFLVAIYLMRLVVRPIRRAASTGGSAAEGDLAPRGRA